MGVNKNKKCVYTVITNDYCDLMDFNIKIKGWDFICFTNNKKIKSNFWKLRYIENNTKDVLENIKLAKKYKMLGFKELEEYDVFLYIDARISIIGDINKYLKLLNGSDILLMKHGGSILTQMKELTKHRYENKEMVETIKKRYEKHGYSYDNGLFAGGVLLFRPSNDVVKFFEDWWNEVKYYSHRDQLSGCFALFLNPNLKYKIIKTSIYGSNGYFSLKGKRKKSRFKNININK